MLPLPLSGRFAVVVLLPLDATGKRRAHHTWFNHKSEINSDFINKLHAANAAGADVYYSTGSFSGELTKWAGRSAANTVTQRSVFLDIDAKDQADGQVASCLVELNRFYIAAKLPAPTTVVETGNGCHAYWVFDQDIPVAEWQPVANNLRWAAEGLQLRLDTKVTTDRARILRLPGFLNTKNNALSSMRQTGSAYSFADIAATLAPHTTVQSAPRLMVNASPTVGLNNSAFATVTADKDYPPAKWEVIKITAVSECAVMREAIANQDKQKYDLWTGVLSIAAATDDVSSAIAAWTGQHKDFNAVEAETKAATFDGPRTCEALSDAARTSGLGSDLCGGCAHRDKIKSPVRLAALNLPTTVEVIAPTGKSTALTLHALPLPYFTKPTGGVWIKVRSGEKDDSGVELMEEIRLMREDIRLIGVSEIGATPGSEQVTYKFQYVHKRNGLRRFLLTPSDFGPRGELVTKLGNALIDCAQLASPNERLAVSKFLQTLVTLHNDTMDVTKSVEHFGPTDEGSRNFVLGDYIYTPDGKHTPVILTQRAQVLGSDMPAPPESDAELTSRDVAIAEWNAQLKSVMPDSVAHGVDQFVLCSGFGTALAPFITPARNRGGLVVVNSHISGSGKSSLVERATHIYTAGSAKFVTPDSTRMGFLEGMMQVANAIPCSWDEMCKNEPKGAGILQDMALCSSNRKQRDRKGAESTGTWNTWIYATMNPDPHALLASIGGAEDGALYRVLSLKTDSARFGTGSQLVAAQNKAQQLERWGHKHGGQVGTKWVQYFMPRLDELTDRYGYWMDRFQRECPHIFTGKGERFSVAICVTTLVAAEAAAAAGLHPFDVESVFAYAQLALSQSLSVVSVSSMSDDTIIAEMLNHSIDVTLTAVDGGLGLAARLPTKQVGIRTNSEAGKVVSVEVSVSYIREYASRSGIDPNRIINLIMAVPKATRNKLYLARGTALGQGQTRCLVFPADGLELPTPPETAEGAPS
jgi:hypothetical protein